jgi:hypothetical protein
MALPLQSDSETLAAVDTAGVAGAARPKNGFAVAGGLRRRRFGAVSERGKMD